MDDELTRKEGLFQADIPRVSFSISDVNQSIPERFEKIARLYPDKLALKQGNVCLTYAELNQVANRLARTILDNQEPGERPVAFLLDHGISPVIAILGILKAGRFYLPLDSSFPQSRLTYFLENSGAKIIITDQEHLAFARSISQEKISFIDLKQVDETIPVKNLGLEISPDCLANLIYTSGSSGKPKGVPQTHRNLLHSAFVYTNSMQLTIDDRMSLLFSTSFAASTNAILGALLNGMALFPFDSKRDLASMAEWVRRERITIFGSVPTLMRHFGSLVAGKENIPSVRMVSLGGETVLRSDFELFRQVFPEDCRLRIGLGGTEMLTISSITLAKKSEISEKVMPVGYPVEDVEIFLVDEAGNLVEPGQTGEIVVRTLYLSPGYWHRPDLTELRFKADAGGDDTRLYYTGDLGRMRPDGCLFHLGRRDFQVKIRGFRVEVEEIEAEISQHPGVQEAAVVVDDRVGLEKRLLAYYVPAKNQPAPSIEELRIYLKKRLPDYMIPFAFISLEAMPLTPSGKIDRLALPSLGEVFNLENDFVSPRDDVELKLVQIWEELLEVSPIGIKNDFFMIGGHSLLAATLITRIEADFGERIDFGILSKTPTIEHLAEVLRKADGSVLTASLVPIQTSGSRPPMYFVHGMGGHVIPFLQLAHHLGTEQPVYGLQAKAVNGSENDQRSIEGIAGDYLKEILELQPTGPYLLGGFSFGGIVAYEMARQLVAKGEKIALLAILDTQVRGLPGFEKSLSRVGQVHYRARSLQERILNRLSNIAGQKNSEWIGGKPTEQEVIMGDVAQEEVPAHLQLIMKINGDAFRKYVPKGYHGKITLFKSGYHGRGVHYGWEELTDGGVEAIEIPGTHRGILQEPSVAILATQLLACIDKNLLKYQQNVSAGLKS